MRTGEFYPLVPKDPVDNTHYRFKLVRDGSRDPAKAAELIECCKRDVLFFFNTFLWTFNPKLPGNKVLPFITYPYQDDSILTVVRAIDKPIDLCIEKSRDMGATWMILCVFLWKWLFFDYNTFLIGSRDQSYVDQTGNHKALFQKLDFALERLPPCLLRGYESKTDTWRTKNHMEHPLTRSVIDGEATTEDFGRGDRRTAILLDEFGAVKGLKGREILSSVHDTSDCCITNSTHKGVDRAFYAETRKPGILHIKQHWSQHPVKAVGLYRDPENGRLRSPWYDRECERRKSKVEIAQELDCDAQGSGAQFFDSPTIQQLIAKARVPYKIGDLRWDKSYKLTSVFDCPDGKLRLWFALLPDYSLPEHRYLIAVDTSQGMGASNSVAAVWDRLTCERVAEYVTSRMAPEKFAEVVVALGNWFSFNGSPAYLIAERNGPGEVLLKRVVELGYKNLYYDIKNEGSLKQTISDRPGWHASPEKKDVVFEGYRSMLFSGDCVNSCVESLDECNSIVFNAAGHVEHMAHYSTIEDFSDARANHADRVTADALAAKILATSPRERPEAEVFMESSRILPNSMAGRRKAAREEARAGNWSWRD